MVVEISVTEYRDKITKSEWHRERWMDVAREIIGHKYPSADVFDNRQLNAFGRTYLKAMDGGKNYQLLSHDMKRIMKAHGIHGEVCLIYYTGWLRSNDVLIKREYWRASSYIPKDYSPKMSQTDRLWLDERTAENQAFQCEDSAIQFFQTGVWNENYERKFAKELGILIRRKCLLVLSEKGEEWVKDIMRKRGISIIDPPPWREAIAIRMSHYSKKRSAAKLTTPPTAPASSIPVE
jgi:hypothetical protein